MASGIQGGASGLVAGGTAFAVGVVLALLGVWGGISAITPAATKAPAELAVYDER